MTRDTQRKPTQLPRTSGERGSFRSRSDEVSVRLTRKYAEMIDGVNLVDADVGDRLALSRRDANMLIAEGWAVPSEERPVRLLPGRAHAADTSRRPKNKKK